LNSFKVMLLFIILSWLVVLVIISAVMLLNSRADQLRRQWIRDRRHDPATRIPTRGQHSRSGPAHLVEEHSQRPDHALWPRDSSGVAIAPELYEPSSVAQDMSTMYADTPWVDQKLEDFRLLGASMIGRAHSKRSLPLEDAFHWKQLGNGVLIVAVADGVGSTRNAHIASGIACHEAVRTMHEILGEYPDQMVLRSRWNDIGWDVMARCRDALNPYFVDSHPDARLAGMPSAKRNSDPATTLLAVVFLRTGDLVTAYWVSVGDTLLLSATPYVSGKRSEWLIHTPNTVETPVGTISNRTFALPQHEREARCGVATSSHSTPFLLATDGFIETLGEREDYDPFTTMARFGGLSRADFLASAAAPLRYCHDDRTAIIVSSSGRPWYDRRT